MKNFGPFTKLIFAATLAMSLVACGPGEPSKPRSRAKVDRSAQMVSEDPLAKVGCLFSKDNDAIKLNCEQTQDIQKQYDQFKNALRYVHESSRALKARSLPSVTSVSLLNKHTAALEYVFAAEKKGVGSFDELKTQDTPPSIVIAEEPETTDETTTSVKDLNSLRGVTLPELPLTPP